MMIDTSKLKYFNMLCEKGIIDEKQNDLDSIMDSLEEKQFECLKRLETTKDERRKEEINETLNIIDLQLKEISSLKSAIDSGIIITSKDELTPKAGGVAEQNNRVGTEQRDNDNRERKKGKIGLIAIAIAIVAVVAIAGLFIINGSRDNQNTASNDNTENTEESTSDNENDNSAKIGFGYLYGEECQQLIEAEGVEEKLFQDGIYIVDITNPALAEAGAKIGDRVVTLNGVDVSTIEEISAITSQYKPGDEVVLVVSRNSDNVTINTKLVSKSELQPSRTTGEETVLIEGRMVRISYFEDSYGINVSY